MANFPKLDFALQPFAGIRDSFVEEMRSLEPSGIFIRGRRFTVGDYRVNRNKTALSG